jgi:hypothetical protein
MLGFTVEPRRKNFLSPLINADERRYDWGWAQGLVPIFFGKADFTAEAQKHREALPS